MEENERIVRYTKQELDDMIARGEDRTDWARVDAMTEEELQASIDFEEEGVPDWGTLQVGIPGPKVRLNVLLDVEVVEWFKALGAGHQTRIHEVLGNFVEDQKRNKALHAESDRQ